MDQEQIENTIQFLVDNQAKFHSDLELLKENVQGIAKNQERTGQQIQALTANVEAMRLEMREAFDNLIIANEVTRNLAEQIGKLAVSTSQRVTKLEEQNS
jgi:hypothetical protein